MEEIRVTKAVQLYRTMNGIWLCLEILIDFILITWSIALLAEIQDEFYNVLKLGATVYVSNDENYFGPVQILCMHSNSKQISNNCDAALLSQSQTTAIQNYFSLKYLEVFRGDIAITVDDIIDDRHNLFIVLSIYIVIWFCLSCAGKLQENTRDYDGSYPHSSYYFSICYLENSLATFKMMMINVFAVSETVDGVLLLEYIPGFSLIVFMVFSIVMGCCLGAMQEMYTKHVWMKSACICVVIGILILYFMLFIFPSFGLNVYALQFLFEFTAVSNGLLSVHFVNSVNLLRSFAFYMGFIGWFKTVTPLISMCVARKRTKNALLAGSPQPTYTL